MTGQGECRLWGGEGADADSAFPPTVHLLDSAHGKLVWKVGLRWLPVGEAGSGLRVNTWRVVAMFSFIR